MSNNPQKQTFKVPVSWVVEGEIEVKAWNRDNAIDKAHEAIEKGHLPILVTPQYDSVEVIDAYPAPIVEPREQPAQVAEPKEVVREVKELTDNIRILKNF